IVHHLPAHPKGLFGFNPSWVSTSFLISFDAFPSRNNLWFQSPLGIGPLSHNPPCLPPTTDSLSLPHPHPSPPPPHPPNPPPPPAPPMTALSPPPASGCASPLPESFARAVAAWRAQIGSCTFRNWSLAHGELRHTRSKKGARILWVRTGTIFCTWKMN
ncbi:hypothetical protein HKBW3S42_02496, partial [Candidatus Hakubella thermalkaliphila]